MADGETTVDIDSGRRELTRSLEPTERYRPPDPPGVMLFGSSLPNRGSQRVVVTSAHVVEQILGRVLPRWKTEVPRDRNEEVNRWCRHREAAQRADVALQRDAVIRERLGDDAPRLSAPTMHPWVWQGAGAVAERSLPRSGHRCGKEGQRRDAEQGPRPGRR
ncbi:hypothetical protein [Streptomyces sp. NPDC126503]|uniref:hypothetical protein n=1 Tax=Streptomyces sp. NPDC126503 TaxID=3155315 RepID=UPI003321D32A